MPHDLQRAQKKGGNFGGHGKPHDGDSPEEVLSQRKKTPGATRVKGVRLRDCGTTRGAGGEFKRNAASAIIRVAMRNKGGPSWTCVVSALCAAETKVPETQRAVVGYKNVLRLQVSGRKERRRRQAIKSELLLSSRSDGDTRTQQRPRNKASVVQGLAIEPVNNVSLVQVRDGLQKLEEPTPDLKTKAVNAFVLCSELRVEGTRVG